MGRLASLCFCIEASTIDYGSMHSCRQWQRPRLRLNPGTGLWLSHFAGQTSIWSLKPSVHCFIFSGQCFLVFSLMFSCFLARSCKQVGRQHKQVVSTPLVSTSYDHCYNFTSGICWVVLDFAKLGCSYEETIISLPWQLITKTGQSASFG